MPVHFPIINTSLVKPITKNANVKISKAVLPIVTVPIGAYYMGETCDNYAQKVIDFFNEKKIPLPSVLEKDPNGKGGYSWEAKLLIFHYRQNWNLFQTSR